MVSPVTVASITKIMVCLFIFHVEKVAPSLNLEISERLTFPHLA